MPAWVIAIFFSITALVPAGVYFTAAVMSHTHSGHGTGPAFGAPGPLVGAGVMPALLAGGAAYWVARRSRRRSAGK